VSVERSVFKTWRFGCETCHAERERLQWSYEAPPQCCGAPMTLGSRGSRQTLQIITDDVPGGFTVENGFKTPQTFYSKSEHRRALSERGLRIADRGEIRH
jgi:hypothetical protein